MAAEELGDGFYGGEAGLEVASVVQDDVGGEAVGAVAEDALFHAVAESFRGGGEPVLDDDVPVDGVETMFPCDAEDGGAAGAVRGTEETDAAAKGVFKGPVAVCDLSADAALRKEVHPGVVHGVVADDVAGGGDSAGEGGGAEDVGADEEEGGLDVVDGEDFQELGGGEGVGSVVKGEGDLRGVGRGDEDGAAELGLGVEHGIGCRAHGQAGGGEDGRRGFDQTFRDGHEWFQRKCFYGARV